MNLLIEEAPDFLTVGGIKIKIKTDFFVWVKFFVACESGCEDKIYECISEIVGNEKCEPKAFIEESMKWMFPKNEATPKRGKSSINNQIPFDFATDGNVIYCELWRYYPEMIKRGITFHEGMELIKLLLNDQNTFLWHLAFARCGDFSKMDKNTQKYWNQQRALYSVKKKTVSLQEDKDRWLYNAL